MLDWPGAHGRVIAAALLSGHGGVPAPHGDSALLAEFLVKEEKQQYVIIVESQTEPDRDIHYRWPYYITYLHNKPAELVELLLELA